MARPASWQKFLISIQRLFNGYMDSLNENLNNELENINSIGFDDSF